eukprot:6572131-Ditylum_brightwellii.AAC.1
MEEIYNEMEEARNDFEFEKIFDHRFEKGMLVLKTRYYSEVLREENIMDIPFNILKKDNPVALARYIKEFVVKTSRRNGTCNKWATK